MLMTHFIIEENSASRPYNLSGKVKMEGTSRVPGTQVSSLEAEEGGGIERSIGAE